jgi:hypothetical protein
LASQFFPTPCGPVMKVMPPAGSPPPSAMSRSRTPVESLLTIQGIVYSLAVNTRPGYLLFSLLMTPAAPLPPAAGFFFRGIFLPRSCPTVGTMGRKPGCVDTPRPARGAVALRCCGLGMRLVYDDGVLVHLLSSLRKARTGRMPMINLLLVCLSGSSDPCAVRKVVMSRATHVMRNSPRKTTSCCLRRLSDITSFSEETTRRTAGNGSPVRLATSFSISA